MSFRPSPTSMHHTVHGGKGETPCGSATSATDRWEGPASGTSPTHPPSQLSILCQGPCWTHTTASSDLDPTLRPRGSRKHHHQSSSHIVQVDCLEISTWLWLHLRAPPYLLFFEKAECGTSCRCHLKDMPREPAFISPLWPCRGLDLPALLARHHASGL